MEYNEKLIAICVLIICLNLQNVKGQMFTGSEWSNWKDWDCSVTCGNGTRLRTRMCLHAPWNWNATACYGEEKKQIPCETGNICGEAIWSWSEWSISKCDRSCYLGFAARRSRECQVISDGNVLLQKLLKLKVQKGQGCIGSKHENLSKCDDNFKCFTSDNRLSETKLAEMRKKLNEMHVSVVAEEGTTVLLPCMTKDDTSNKFSRNLIYSWQRNGKDMPLYFDKVKSWNDAGIELKKVSSNDNGVYTYLRYFNKQDHQIACVITLVVNPRKSSKEAYLYEPLKLKCHGIYLAKIFQDSRQLWFHGNVLVSNTTFKNNEDQFSIESLKSYHFGVWRCIVYDPHHIRSWKTNIIKLIVQKRKCLPCNYFEIIDSIALIIVLVLIAIHYITYKVFKFLKNRSKEQNLDSFDHIEDMEENSL